MTSPLWTLEALALAAHATLDGAPKGDVGGIAIDTRVLAPGDLFVALKDRRDGHEFVGQAFAAGAAAALVRTDYARGAQDGALLRVPDVLGGLEAIGRAARARLAADARVLAVTGSVGKTGTKEMLRAALSRLGPTHAADKSFNNHWGVPLTLARMPAATRFGVFEIGMNHAGEIGPLARMVRPDVAIVTTVAPVHLEFFASVEAIAEAKAEIFEGLSTGGLAMLNRDNAHFDLLARRAFDRGARVVSFGRSDRADVVATKVELGADNSRVTARAGDEEIIYTLGAAGDHLVQNSLAVVAAIVFLGLDPKAALPALAALAAAPGRGARVELETGQGPLLIIDESYNANPASMAAALRGLAQIPRTRFRRRVAVIGDMLELGSEAPRLHAALKEDVDAAGADLVFASGTNMAHLFEALPASRQGAWAATSEGIREPLVRAVGAGDVVMIKGSLGSRMAPLVEVLKARFGGGEGGR